MGARATESTMPGPSAVLHSRLHRAAALVELGPGAVARATAVHDAVVAEAVARCGGVRREGHPSGDGVVAVFARAADALVAACRARQALDAHRTGGGRGAPVVAQMALHCPDPSNGDPAPALTVALDRCARLGEIANGGQVLLSRAVRDLLGDRPPAGVGFADLGVHRLRDLGRPEHVHAAIDPGRSSDAAPLRSLDAVANNLPVETTSFVGRRRELEEVRAALAATPLLTLAGAGGCGKTRLALHAAADALDRFPGGIWWVPLAAVGDGDRVGQALAEAVGVRAFPGRDALEAAIGDLATQRALVILDNCEHVLDGAAVVAAALLRGCPALTVLATSRVPLGLPAETTSRVPSLGQADAVGLFVERAAKVRPGFAPDPATAEAVAELCRALDGIPLAIELAAARVRALPVAQIGAGLSDRFHLLTGGGRGVLPRHRTLRASVDWSHELLSGAERTLLRRLAVFVDGFGLDMAERVGAGGTLPREAILDVVCSLVDQSMVVAEQHGSPARYRLLETVREYALERLGAAGETGAVRDRHVQAFLALAEETAPGLLTGRQHEALARLDRDAANLTAALERAAAARGDAALRLCAALTHWWKLRGRFAEADAGYTAALAGGDQARSALRARVLWGRAYLLTYAGRYEEAITTAEDALAMAEEIGDAAGCARALDVLGTMELTTNPAGSRARLGRACALARATADDWCLVDATQVLAFTHLFVDEYDAGEALLDEVLPLIERSGYGEFVAWHWCGMSLRPLAEADFARLFDVAGRAIRAARAVGEPVTEATAQTWIAAGELAQGRAETAAERLGVCRARTVATGAGMSLPLVDTTLAAARAALGDLAGPRTALEGVVASGADGGYSLAGAWAQLADTLRAGGETVAAERAAGDALAVARRIGAPALVSRATEILGRLAATRGDWRAAEALLHDALDRRVQIGHRLGQPQLLEALAEAAAGSGRHEDAARLLGAARRARRDMGTAVWAPDLPALVAAERATRSHLGDAASFRACAEGETLALHDAVAWVRRMRGPRRRPPAGWGSLTPTELQVARHAAAGRTNPEIAAAMFISRATVKAHLSHVYAKLSVRNRSELAGYAAQHDGRG